MIRPSESGRVENGLERHSDSEVPPFILPDIAMSYQGTEGSVLESLALNLAVGFSIQCV